MNVIKKGIQSSIAILSAYIILVLVNLSPFFRCEPRGVYRFDWLYPFKYWFTNYSNCGIQFIDVVVAGIIWGVFGFVIGLLIGLIIKKIK